MEIIFEELVKENLPGGNEEGEFSIIKEDEYFVIYHGSSHKDQIIKFNLAEADSNIFASACKKIFGLMGYELNEETKKWNK